MRLSEASRTLTIGERTGKFAGMVESRKFRVVLVSQGHGVGETVSLSADAVVEYTGKTVETTFSSKRAQ
jgi:alpha-D-xyloside xylohydrolase